MPDSSTQPAPEPQATDTLALRAAFGQFATGVCIVASPPAGEADLPFAITISSFASVSLRPPIVSWCIQKSSTTYALWMATQQFGISVLNEMQGAVCERFAVRGDHAMSDPGDYVLSPNGSPLVPGAVATFDCRVNAIHDAGDHKLILADVLAFTSDETHRPLIYVRGGIVGPA